MTARTRRHVLASRLRLARVALRALVSTDHPVLVHLIVVRRCNLACAYCNEYDDHSEPVPADALRARLDHLADLGASIVTLSGGEPMLHPHLDDLIRHVRGHGMIPELLTNGSFLTVKRIQELNAAGLLRLQISIDNVVPDEVSKKSLKVLDPKLVRLAEHAAFDVNINSVRGGGVERAEDALAITARARALGFSSTVGVIHDGDGQLRPLSPPERDVYRRLREGGVSFSALTRFKDNLVAGRPNDWRCRAGARYLYVCEDGLVHYCSQQRGAPARPLLAYTRDDIRRAFNEAKACAPYCTISCVHTVALLDNWRAPQTASADLPPRVGSPLVSISRGPAGRA
jgi:MoaA/NifB/PqqE/SkfB family radical SAM enzyme